MVSASVAASAEAHFTAPDYRLPSGARLEKRKSGCNCPKPTHYEWDLECNEANLREYMFIEAEYEKQRAALKDLVANKPTESDSALKKRAWLQTVYRVVAQAIDATNIQPKWLQQDPLEVSIGSAGWDFAVAMVRGMPDNALGAPITEDMVRRAEGRLRDLPAVWPNFNAFRRDVQRRASDHGVGVVYVPFSVKGAINWRGDPNSVWWGSDNYWNAFWHGGGREGFSGKFSPKHNYLDGRIPVRGGVTTSGSDKKYRRSQRVKRRYGVERTGDWLLHHFEEHPGWSLHPSHKGGGLFIAGAQLNIDHAVALAQDILDRSMAGWLSLSLARWAASQQPWADTGILDISAGKFEDYWKRVREASWDNQVDATLGSIASLGGLVSQIAPVIKAFLAVGMAIVGPLARLPIFQRSCPEAYGTGDCPQIFTRRAINDPMSVCDMGDPTGRVTSFHQDTSGDVITEAFRPPPPPPPEPFALKPRHLILAGLGLAAGYAGMRTFLGEPVVPKNVRRSARSATKPVRRGARKATRAVKKGARSATRKVKGAF